MKNRVMRMTTQAMQKQTHQPATTTSRTNPTPKKQTPPSHFWHYYPSLRHHWRSRLLQRCHLRQRYPRQARPLAHWSPCDRHRPRRHRMLSQGCPSWTLKRVTLHRPQPPHPSDSQPLQPPGESTHRPRPSHRLPDHQATRQYPPPATESPLSPYRSSHRPAADLQPPRLQPSHASPRVRPRQCLRRYPAS